MERPYIIISTAMSIDGKIGTVNRHSIAFSNKEDERAVDRLRSECDAVLVGSTTLTNDNPRLISKYGGKNPIKVAISKNLDIDMNCNFLQMGDSKKIIFTANKAPKEKIEEVQKYAQIFVSDNGLVDVKEIVKKLSEIGVRKLLLEGGGETNYLFLKENLVDELRIAIAPFIVGGKDTPTLVDGTQLEGLIGFKLANIERLGEMIILHYKKMQDADYMKLALEEAKKCPPTEKAYNVGCVIVKEGKIISRGYSRKDDAVIHAEESAFNQAEGFTGATLYSTMEPCSKRISKPTACAQYCIDKGIKKVVFGTHEPLLIQDCKGEELLKEAGVEVVHLKDMEEECLDVALNERQKKELRSH